MNKEIIKRMDDYLAACKEEILDCVMTLARFPSIAAEPLPDAPYGKECRKCLDAAVDIMKKGGFDARVCSGGKYGLATLGDGEKTIGLFAHTDVVPVSEEDWMYTKPFEPVRLGDVLVGRGVLDNKSGVAISLYAVKMLCELGLAPKSKISVFLGSNEECGMDDIDAYTAENDMPDVSLVPDAEFPVSFGEKGICRAHIIFEDKFTDIVDFYGGSAYNILLDKAVAKIKYSDSLYAQITEMCKDRKDLKAEKCDDVIKVTALGISRHAAMPEGGVNAASVLAGALCTCTELCENDRKILSRIAELTSDFYGESLGIACSDECFGKLTSVNGICKTTDGAPDIALDIRYGTGISAEELERKILAAYPKAEIKENMPGFAIPRDDKIAKSLERVYSELSGDPDAKGFYMGGGTYARHLKNAFSIGTEAEYIENALPSLPAGHGDAHQSDEVLKINRFIEALKIVALMLHECDKILSAEN